MEISSIRELSQLGMEDPELFNQWNMNSFDQLSNVQLAATVGENLQHSFPDNYPTAFNLITSVQDHSPDGMYRPPKQLKANSWNSCITDTADASNLEAAFSPNSVSFTSYNVKPKEMAACSENPFGSQNHVLEGFHGAKRVSTGSRILQTKDHIMTERKRRERLSQNFIALSAVIPGLKKIDKASVLGEAIKYLKQLQEKVKTLEEQTRKKSTESAVFVRKSRLFADMYDFPSDENLSDPFDEPLPEIEARTYDRSVLIRIHCEKGKGVSEKIMSEIEKCHLTVINSNVMTFGSSTFDITVVAQMDMEFCMTVKDLVKKLRASFN